MKLKTEYDLGDLVVVLLDGGYALAKINFITVGVPATYPNDQQLNIWYGATAHWKVFDQDNRKWIDISRPVSVGEEETKYYTDIYHSRMRDLEAKLKEEKAQLKPGDMQRRVLWEMQKEKRYSRNVRQTEGIHS